LKNLAETENVRVDKNPFLEDWFLTDPVEQIVSFEAALMNQQKNVGLTREYYRGKYHYTIEILFDWFR
jgi:hypothetical protein